MDARARRHRQLRRPLRGRDARAAVPDAGLAPRHGARRGQVRRHARRGLPRSNASATLHARGTRLPFADRGRRLRRRGGRALSARRCSAAARSRARSIPRCSTSTDAEGIDDARRARRVRARSRADRRGGAQAWRRSRVRGAAHRAGPGARSAQGCRSAWSPRSTAATASRSRSTGMAGHAGTVPMGLRQRRARRRCRMRAGSRAHRARMRRRRRHRRPHRGASRRDERDSRQGAVLARRARAHRRQAACAPSRRCARSSTRSPRAARRRALRRAAVGGEDGAVRAAACSGRSPRAIAGEGIAVHHLPSGAGHDGMAIIDIAPIGMLFVRCKGGISHNPAEAVTRPTSAIGRACFCASSSTSRRRAISIAHEPFRCRSTPPFTRSSRRIAREAERFLAELVRVPSDNPPGRLRAARASAPRAIARRRWASSVEASRRAGGARARQRDGELHQSRRARALRQGGPGDRAQRARRRGSAGLRLDRGSLRRRSARRQSCTAAASRCRSPTSRRTRSRCARSQAAAAQGAQLRRHGRAPLHLRRGGGRRDRAGLAAAARESARPTSRFPRGSPTASPPRTTAACISRSRSSASPGHAAEPEKGVDALEAATGILSDLYALRKTYARDHARTIPGIASPTLVVGLIAGGINTNVVPDRVRSASTAGSSRKRIRPKSRRRSTRQIERVRARSGRRSACA